MGNEESRFLKEGQVGLYSTKDILIFTFDDWTKLWGRLREDAVLELYANKNDEVPVHRFPLGQVAAVKTPEHIIVNSSSNSNGGSPLMNWPKRPNSVFHQRDQILCVVLDPYATTVHWLIFYGGSSTARGWFNLIVPTVIKAHEQQRAAAEAEAGTSSGRGKRDRVDEEKHASVVDTVLKRAIQVVRLGAYGANLGYYLYKIVNDA